MCCLIFWIVEENRFNERKHPEIIEALQKHRIPHAVVKIVPFAHTLLDVSESSQKAEVEIIAENEKVMVLGTVTLAQIAAKRKWQPGSFLNDNFHYDIWRKAYGRHLLNYESVVGKFRDIDPLWDSFFIRPCEDTKDFAGTVITKTDFKVWQGRELKGRCPYSEASVMASPLQIIHSEYRFFVVGEEVVTGSRYRQNGELSLSSDIPLPLFKFAQERVGEWRPAQSFVLDVAETTNGMKVIEINNINSAGFYEADVEKLVLALERTTIN